MPKNHRRARPNASVRGFTLVELAIVLVIVGLLAGAILVGESLIRGAEISSQVAQIEKYNSSVNAFRSKYNGLPGDLILSTATGFNFAGLAANGCSGANIGQRNGDGLIDGWPGLIYSQTVGETALFWEDLSSAGLIDSTYPKTGQFNCTSALNLGGANPPLANDFPTAKIGSNNYVYVIDYNNANWFGVAAITSIASFGGVPTTAPNIRAIQAYSMDMKMDDGVPTTGSVRAMYITNGAPPVTLLQAASNAAADSATTCYNTTGPSYSTAINDGTNATCALIFKFQ